MRQSEPLAMEAFKVEHGMHITESNVTGWGLRPQEAAAVARERQGVRERETPTATIASQVDKSPRDGWIDDDDLPYDQLELLQRARAAEVARAALPEPVAEVRDTPGPAAAAPAEPRAAHVDVTAADAPEAPPQVDLLA